MNKQIYFKVGIGKPGDSTYCVYPASTTLREIQIDVEEATDNNDFVSIISIEMTPAEFNKLPEFEGY